MQAQSLSFWLPIVSPTVLMCSDLTRAMQTARPGLKACPSIQELIYSDSLRERALGSHEGEKKSYKPLTDVEPSEDLIARFNKTINIHMRHHNTGVCYTHSGAIRFWLSSLGHSVSEVPNGSLCRLMYSKNSWLVTHLPSSNYHKWAL